MNRLSRSGPAGLGRGVAVSPDESIMEMKTIVKNG